MKFYTIGIAGHINHGKTTLTKALTNVDTDHLKEEKERNMSIELGYAPFMIKEGYHVTIIDVPGHERFIKKMIAGVNSIDLIIMVVAADEGIMPQTKEHMEIVSLLGIEQAIIVITKVDLVDIKQIRNVEKDIHNYVKGTTFEKAEVIYVDGVSKLGISELKKAILKKLDVCQLKNEKGYLRIPIDKVSTLKGYGKVLRGTVVEGVITSGEEITILPDGFKAKVRQLQSHNCVINKAVPGQRVGISISGTKKLNLKRGQIVSNGNHFVVSNCFDAKIRTTRLMTLPLKQRSQIKLYIGTSEVLGKIVFFDRNTLENLSNIEVYCQIRLDYPVVLKTGDRFILRRPSPMETIAGGIVINPIGKKYKFGKDTISMLQAIDNSSPLERIILLLKENNYLSIEDISKHLGMNLDETTKFIHEGISNGQLISLAGQILAKSTVEELQNDILQRLKYYHEKYPLKFGISKAELLQNYSDSFPNKVLNEIVQNLSDNNKIRSSNSKICLYNFKPEIPKEWHRKLNEITQVIANQTLEPISATEIIEEIGVPESLSTEFMHYLKNQEIFYELDNNLFIHKRQLTKIIHTLKSHYVESFCLQDAKKIIKIRRKYLILILELLDRIGETRFHDNRRTWRKV